MADHEVVEANTLLAPFNPIEAEISKYKAENEKLVFNYEDPKGNKEARSHIFKLRQVKSTIAKIHKEVKENVLAVSRSIDAKKNTLTDAIESMIKVHADPIEAIEQRIAAEEAERVRKEQEAKDAAEAARLEAIRQQEEANRIRQAELDAQAAVIAAKQAELDRQEREKREAAEREEREKRIAEQAAQKAKDDAAHALKDAEERHQLELQQAEAKRQADLKAAEEKAARDKAAKEAEAKRLADIEAKRQANVKHRAKVHQEVSSIFTDYGMSNEKAMLLITALSNDLFLRLKIIY